MKYEIKETKVMVIIKRVEADNAIEAEEKDKAGDFSIVQKQEQSTIDMHELVIVKPPTKPGAPLQFQRPNQPTQQKPNQLLQTNN